MKKIIMSALVIITAALYTNRIDAQSKLTYANNSNQLYADNVYNNLPYSEIKENLYAEPVLKPVKRKTKRVVKNTFNTSLVSKIITTNKTSKFSEIKKIKGDAYFLTVKQIASTVGHVSVKEAAITYNKSGVQTVKLTMTKQTGKIFVEANQAMLGVANNENVMDNATWLNNDFVLEIRETKSTFTAIYKKATGVQKTLNEGVAMGLF